jgi:V/A-type H+/Na+-transporting ATPase subunit I
MFYPQEMTEVELIVPTKDLVAVTKALSGLGAFHQVDASYLNSASVSGTAHPWQESAAAFNALDRRVQMLMQSLGLDEGDPPTSKFEDMVDMEKTRAAVERIEQETKRAAERLNAEAKHLEQLQVAQRDVEPLAGLDIDINFLREAQYVHTILGTMPVANMDRMQTSLSRIPYVFLPLRQDHNTALVWLAGLKSNSDVIDRAARSAYLTPLALPEGYSGRPADLLKTIKDDIQTAEKAIAETRLELGKLGKTHQKELHSLLWDIRSSRMLADAIVRYGRLKFTYVVVGWVPVRNLEEMTQRVKQVSKEALIETYAVEREDRTDVPVALSSNRLLRPFQLLVTTYARPRYGELDPTLLIAITFPLLYGTMFGDVGHGLLLAALGILLMSRRVKALNSFAGLGGLITACGGVAFVFGFVYGSIFGFEEVIHPLWIHPMEHIMDILLITIGAGIILLNIGFFINIFNNWKQREWAHVLFGQTGLSGVLLYWGMIGMLAAGYFGKQFVPPAILLVLIAIGAIGVMFAEVFKHLIEGHRPLIVGGVGTFVIQSFFEIFETFISFLSNSLSYVRVGAFAVAHGGLSAVIFVLGEMVSPNHGIGYWIVVALGNLFIVGFEGLIVGIQTMRLEYYEFFSKFFKGGGLRYEPLKLRPAGDD